jgi:folate-dependent phosphoribosylglycinamide formyltransferase PurN
MDYWSVDVEIPFSLLKETDYGAVEGEGDPSLATFAKASVAETLGMTLHLFKGGGGNGEICPRANLPISSQSNNNSLSSRVERSVMRDLPDIQTLTFS